VDSVLNTHNFTNEPLTLSGRLRNFLAYPPMASIDRIAVMALARLPLSLHNTQLDNERP
jgi:hypothetical protein